jgi:general secretion pathway protein G
MHIEKEIPKHLRSTNSKGLTLVEILIVIAIIATLATVAIGNLGGIFSGQQDKIASIFVKQTAKLVLTNYKLDVGSYPTTEQGLKALTQAPAGKESRWNGPYVDEPPVDPWGNAYKYSYPGSKNINKSDGYDIWSLGQDGVQSADDIGNWN